MTLQGGVFGHGNTPHSLVGVQPGNIWYVKATGVTTDIVDGGQAGNPLYGGYGQVFVGNKGSVQDINRTLNLRNPTSFNEVTLDDSADTTYRNVTLSTLSTDTTFGQVVGLAPATIKYKYADTSVLTVRGGSGSNTWNVLATGFNFGPNSGVTTNIVAGGPDVVTVGNNHTVSEILGTLNIKSLMNTNTINIDDAVDARPRTVPGQLL